MARILLVDNDGAFLSSRKQVLETSGHLVVPAPSLEEARQELNNKKNLFDLVLIDFRLTDDEDENDYSGITLAQEVEPKIPIIIYSAHQKYVQNEDVRSLFGEEASVDILFSKEGDPMLAAIRSALERKRIRMRSAQRQEEKPARSNRGAIVLLILAGVTGAFAIFAGSLAAVVLTFFLITFGLIAYMRSMAAKS